MTITPGTKLGRYEIRSKIGEGGMGEVYLARDTKLNRDVAIKVLPAALSQDGDRLRRFEQEAQAASALNHPNILAVFDFGEHDGAPFVVSELLEGESMKERLDDGPIAQRKAIDYAVQVTHGLAAAHEKGIVHRDLKPDNLFITNDDRVKILDFGIAKLIEPVSEGIAQTDIATRKVHTDPGTVMGTVGYMSPEQVRGKHVDHRSDIFSFGAVLYEMLTGQRAFRGESPVETLNAILKDEPTELTATSRNIAPALELVVWHCLEKSPERRFQSARDLAFALEALTGSSPVSSQTLTAIAALPARSKIAKQLPWIVAVALLILLLAVLPFAVGYFRRAPAEAHVVTRFTYLLPEGQAFTRLGRHSIAISPDGTKLAYIANQQIYLRQMDQLDAQPIRGTSEDPYDLVFSPDGQWIAYFLPAGSTVSGGILKKIFIGGGAPVTLCPTASGPNGVSWHNGTIAFGQLLGDKSTIQAVADAGGTPRTLVSVDKEFVNQPQLLDDGTHVLMSIRPRSAATQDDADIVVQSLKGGERKVLVHGGTNGQVLSSGHLVYIRDGILFAVAFDAKRLDGIGGPVPVVEGVTETNASGAGQFAIAENGTLVFLPGASTGVQRTLVWVDRQGHEEPIPAKPRAYVYLRLSPDGKQIAVSSRDEENDIWVWDLAKETPMRLTFGPATDDYPVWTKDSRRVIFSTGEADGTHLFSKAADGTGTTDRVAPTSVQGVPQSLSADGKLLVYREDHPGKTGLDLMALPLDPPGAPRALFQTNFDEMNGEVSPDGRWIAYQSNESTSQQIYVRPFPAVETGRWQVSPSGGSKPMWSRSGTELFYFTVVAGGTPRLLAVPVQSGSSFTYGKPVALFDFAPYYFSAPGRTFDIAPDGRRFLLIRSSAADTNRHPSIVVVSHWFDELRARVTGK